MGWQERSGPSLVQKPPTSVFTLSSSIFSTYFPLVVTEARSCEPVRPGGRENLFGYFTAPCPPSGCLHMGGHFIFYSPTIPTKTFLDFFFL